MNSAAPRARLSVVASRDEVPATAFVTIGEFCRIAKVSRRQMFRLRKRRPAGFPREYELGDSLCPTRRSPRFKLADVLAWMETRALW